VPRSTKPRAEPAPALSRRAIGRKILKIGAGERI
jgi:hypothetical protein